MKTLGNLKNAVPNIDFQDELQSELYILLVTALSLISE